MKRLIRGFSDSFWTADAMLIGLLVFIIVVGAASPLDSLPLMAVLFTVLGLWVMHALMMRGGDARRPERRRIRRGV